MSIVHVLKYVRNVRTNMAAIETGETQKEIKRCRSSNNPKRILLFSGKRKSGKDYITNILFERVGPENGVIIKLSGPIKTYWAKNENLDLDQLLGDGEYKEQYRLRMANWSEGIRKDDPGYFCRAAIDMYNAHDKPIWIISDVRRKTDIQWFEQNFGDLCKTVRVTCSNDIRQNRGWTFVAGVDDAETECDLDNILNWDLEIKNDNGDIEDVLQIILKLTA